MADVDDDPDQDLLLLLPSYGEDRQGEWVKYQRMCKCVSVCVCGGDDQEGKKKRQSTARRQKETTQRKKKTKQS